MVELFAADIKQIEPNALSLLTLLDEERQARVRMLGGSVAALRSLAAGLLLYSAFGESTRLSRFEHGKRGKPSLPNGRPFNLTHAGDYAVLALSSRSVGVDLERIRPIDWKKISARFFHPEERAFLAESASPLETFFWIWTLKESYVKAEGLGFSVSPASFCVLPVGEQDARFGAESPYLFRRFRAFSDYCLSLCTQEREITSEVRVLTF